MMSDDNNFYDRLQKRKEQELEYYDREHERREHEKEALRKTTNNRGKPFTHTEIKYEKTFLAKFLRLTGWLITLGTLTSLFFIGDAAKNSDYMPIAGGTGIFLILLPSIGRWIGPVLAVFLVIFLIFSENNGIEDYILFSIGIIVSLFIKRLLWRETSRNSYTVK